jgi:hypothetical protein
MDHKALKEMQVPLVHPVDHKALKVLLDRPVFLALLVRQEILCCL